MVIFHSFLYVYQRVVLKQPWWRLQTPPTSKRWPKPVSASGSTCGRLEAPSRCKRPAEKPVFFFSVNSWDPTRNLVLLGLYGTWYHVIYIYIYITYIYIQQYEFQNIWIWTVWSLSVWYVGDLKNKHDVHHQPFYGVGYGDRTEFKLSIFPNVHVHINMHNCMYIVLKYIMNNNCVSVHIYIMIYTYIHTHISIQPPLTSIHPHSKNGTRIHVLRSSQVDFRLPWLIMVD